MTSKEFFSKENILSDTTFDKVEFKKEITSEDYKKAGAMALTIAFDGDNYIPLSGRIAVEYPILVTLLGLEIEDKLIDEDVFKAIVCYGVYNRFRELYDDYAEFIMRFEMDLVDLISDRRADADRSKGFGGQIVKLINKFADNEAVSMFIDSLTNEEPTRSIETSER